MAFDIAKRYKRWRHTRGFGVHSPLAYSLVCNVIRSPKRGYSYYARPDIVHLLGEGKRIRHEKRRALLLHRLAARYRYRAVNVLTPLPPSMTEALKGVAIGSERVLYVAVDPDIQTVNRLGKACQADNAVVALFASSPGVIARLIAATDKGVALYSPDSAIIFTRADVHKTSYTIII